LSVPEGSTLTFAARLMDQNGEPYVVADAGLCGRDDTCSVTLSMALDCTRASPSPDASLQDAAPQPDATPAVPDATAPDVDAAYGATDGGTPDAASDGGVVDDGSVSLPDAAPSDAAADASDAADAG
jgi:hypothetical protein